MRNLNRNKREIYYALQTGSTNNVDEYGNETSETTPIYGEAVALKINVSAATGEEAVQAFGSFTGYSRTMCVAGNAPPIVEGSAIWFGIAPDKPYNYTVVRKADSKNGVLYALQEVMVT